MRVAVLADIHGNLPALEAVLREVDAASAEVVVLAGDMTVGPLQAETLDLLDSLVLVDSPVEWFVEGFADVEEQTVVCGHTHMPFDGLAGGRRVINPGSVGMPYGPPGTLAYWALLGPDVTLRRTPYDLDKAAERLRTSAWPGTAGFVEENILHGPPSDTEALEIFSDWARQRRSH
jgi:predicted phosphodiesterase